MGGHLQETIAMKLLWVFLLTAAVLIKNIKGQGYGPPAPYGGYGGYQPYGYRGGYQPYGYGYRGATNPLAMAMVAMATEATNPLAMAMDMATEATNPLAMAMAMATEATNPLAMAMVAMATRPMASEIIKLMFCFNLMCLIIFKGMTTCKISKWK